MAESVVKSAAQCLGKLMLQEMVYLGAVRGKVELLRTELTILDGFLADPALKIRRQEESMLTVISEARNIAYDCEDVIERYILKVALQGYEEYDGFQFGTVMRWACLLWKAIHAHQVHSKINKLNKRFIVLKSCMQSYGVTGRIVESGSSSSLHETLPQRQFHPHVRDFVVGLDKHYQELVPMLLDITDQRVIVVSGMGGMGKSTLARELYHHPALRYGDYFEAFGWASVSQRLKIREVLEKLMYSLVPEKDRVDRNKIEGNRIAYGDHGALHQLMRSRKCLVVIDDIWTSEDWQQLQDAFPRNELASGSRIILTTRNKDILSRLDPSQVHHLPMVGLDKAKSWELFEKTAFPGHGATYTDSTKKKLGQQMLRHCKGVPLAIIVLAKLLRGKESASDWEQIGRNISQQIQRGEALNMHYKEVYDVLQVSYDELPSHLKQCFLHLANFPEDYEIPTKKLYQLWIGEMVVSKDPKKDSNHESEEDIAERYLMKLVSRSMVQMVDWDRVTESTEWIKKCRLHDLMRDVCIEISKREGFLQIINCKESMLLNAGHLLMTPLPQRDKTLRRVAVYMSNDEEISDLPTTPIVTSANISRAPSLRSLLLFSINAHQGEEDCEKFVETVSKDFPLLRVLDCENFHIEGKLPKKVGQMIYLRYLGLANTRVTKLPSSIERLQLLQTLDLRVNADTVISIPNILWKMKQLRHLYLPFYGELEIAEKEKIEDAPERYQIKGGDMLRLDGLPNLQTIMHLDLDRLNLEVDLSDLLQRIDTLVAVCETNIEAMYPFLKCSRMKSFKLRLHAEIIDEDPTMLWNCESMHRLDLHSYPYSYRLNNPRCLEMLPKSLVYLGIWYIDLVDDPMPVLEKLPNLETLRLQLCYSGTKMVCSAGGFPKLNYLLFDGLFSFSDWKVKKGALRELGFLMLINCPVKKIPYAIPRTTTVKVFEDGEEITLVR